MDAHAWILIVAVVMLLPAAIASLLVRTWPRPWPYRLSAARIRLSLMLQAVEFLVFLGVFSRALVTPEELGWRGWPTWPGWAFLLALLWGLPWLREFVFMFGRPTDHGQARRDARRAVRALACMVPRTRDAQQVRWLDQHVVNLVHVAFFYGFVVHLGASVLGGTWSGVALGAAFLLATLWHRPRQHKLWFLLLYALQCVLLFSPVGLSGVLVLVVLLSLTDPSPRRMLWDLRTWIEHLRRA